MRPFWLISAACLALTGCFGPQSARLQSADENEPKEAKEPQVETIAKCAAFNPQQDIQVSGVGLVVGLNHTGGGAPPASSLRDWLENDLKKKGVQNVRSLLESPSCAMVLVSARLPKGARRNDPVDVEVSLPDMSHCTSLKGGYLTSCELFTFESTHAVNPNSRKPEQWLKGNPTVKAEGQVITELMGRVQVAQNANGDAAEYQNDEPSQKGGQVYGGGHCLAELPMLLLMNPNYQQSHPGRGAAGAASQIADKINMTFPGMRFGRDGLATAKTPKMIQIGVPLQYRHDIEHYQLVVAAIPMDKMSPAAENTYRRRLAEELLDPVKCQFAAIQLEAMGEESVPALRAALVAQYPLSRFSAALSLTYLRKRDGVDELARLARQQPALRATCLAALASLDESICHARLVDLLAEPDPQLRYGAFRSLQSLDERAMEIAGEKCRDAYWIHQVASDSMPMVHYLTSRRPEIVLFGSSPVLLPGLRLGFGGVYTVAVGEDGTCRLGRYTKDVVQKQCPAQVADVLRTLAEMDGCYSDAIDLLVKADANHKLSCELRHDALPQMVEPSQLERMAKKDPTLQTAVPAATLARGQ
jgi:flagellar basal body P-ring protein FlgI